MSETILDLKVTGLDGLLGQLNDLGEELSAKVLDSAVRRAFQPVLDRAKELAPKDSGALADALRLSVVHPDDGLVAVGIVVAGPARTQKGGKTGDADTLPPARRWHFPELGTAKMAPHPYLRPAFDAANTVDRLAVEIQAGIDRALRKQARAALASAIFAMST
jgi:HK97 gp10 family phage protein